jgi:spore coat polysaccharide biosynthesis protein SpsF (cytidylyltransferase family)
MLQYLLERLDHCSHLHDVVVATSKDESDTPIAGFCKDYGIDCCRGPLYDVAGRFREVLDIYWFDGFVRVSGDSPLLDQRLIDKGVEIFLRSHVDLVTNIFPRTYPSGQSVEVVAADAFRRGYERMHTAEDFEHVTRFFYRNRREFRIHNFASEVYCGDVHLSVDTPQDMEVFAAIVKRMTKPHWQYTLQEILHLHQNAIAEMRIDV